MAEWNPNLASDFEEGKLDYSKGYLFLPKLNGVRGGVQNGVLVSRSKKPTPNNYVRGIFSDPELENFEGELIVGHYADENVFVNSTSGVMSVEGEPDICMYMFDFFHPVWTFERRIAHVHSVLSQYEDPRLVAVPYYPVHSDEEVERLGNMFVEQGYEGGVLRAAKLRYKQGRSTLLEGSFMRWVPWHTSEAVILQIHEGMVNQNVSVKNALGYLEKSSHKENMVGSGRAGSVTVKDVKTGIVFKMAVPDVATEQDVWDHPEKYLQKLLKYKFKTPVKVGGKPRFPQYIGVRHPDDM